MRPFPFVLLATLFLLEIVQTKAKSFVGIINALGALSNAHLNEIFIRIMATEFLFNLFEREDRLLHWKEFKLFFVTLMNFLYNKRMFQPLFIIYEQKILYSRTNFRKLPQHFH